jgi:AcrR family transcriptional regulator
MARKSTLRARKPPIDDGDIVDVRTRLILAGEIAFAEAGIHGASLREIASKAGQGNHFAVQYHFGSRESLVEAIFDYRMEQMEQCRGRMLVAAEMSGRLKDARTLINIVLLPQLELQDADGNHSYARFLSQFLLDNNSTKFGDFGAKLPPNLERSLVLLRARLDYLPAEVAQRRLISASLMFLNILVRHHGVVSLDDNAESFGAALEDTMEQIVASLCMPLRLQKIASASSRKSHGTND